MVGGKYRKEEGNTLRDANASRQTLDNSPWFKAYASNQVQDSMEIGLHPPGVNTPTMIKEFIESLTPTFVSRMKTTVDLQCVILTGSFSFWLKGDANRHPSWNGIPDINYYPFVRGGEEAIVLANKALYESIHSTVDAFKKKGRSFNVMLDLHPFSITPELPRFDGKTIDLQMTTRVLSLDAPNAYPNYCKRAWFSNAYIAYPDKFDVSSLGGVPDIYRDEKWVRDMYLALVSYGNVLQVAPLYSDDKGHLFNEARRYLKELMKDGVGLGIPQNEYDQDKHLGIIFDWHHKAVPFYYERYGEKAGRIAELMKEIDENFFKYYGNDDLDPVELIRLGLILRKVIFENGFIPRANEILKDKTIVKSMFSEMPLWW